MRSQGHTPEYWRARAEAARVIAEAVEDSQCHLLMLSAARTYERLAELIETSHQRTAGARSCVSPLNLARVAYRGGGAGDKAANRD
jgi:hypothetical protein